MTKDEVGELLPAADSLAYRRQARFSIETGPDSAEAYDLSQEL